MPIFDRRGSGHEAAPLGQGGRAERFVGRSIDEVAFGIEVIVDVGMDGGELLQRLHSSESQHCPLSSSEWQVAVLGSIVGVPVRRQNIWRKVGRGLAERWPRLGVDLRRRACGAASGDCSLSAPMAQI